MHSCAEFGTICAGLPISLSVLTQSRVSADHACPVRYSVVEPQYHRPGYCANPENVNPARSIDQTPTSGPDNETKDRCADNRPYLHLRCCRLCRIPGFRTLPLFSSRYIPLSNASAHDDIYTRADLAPADLAPANTHLHAHAGPGIPTNHTEPTAHLHAHAGFSRY